MIVIVDYGIGNLGSVKNMIHKIGGDALISNNREDIEAASKLILPGIGAFDAGMRHLRATGLIELLDRRALVDKIPVLGICLGAQLMTRSSEEGVEKGLGWFDAETKRMTFDGIEGKWNLPNIGWRDVDGNGDYPLLRGFEETPRFYFVHSYFLHADDPRIVSMTSEYGFRFACGLSRQNIHCAQFHPEKSHSFGMRFLRNFMDLHA